MGDDNVIDLASRRPANEEPYAPNISNPAPGHLDEAENALDQESWLDEADADLTALMDATHEDPEWVAILAVPEFGQLQALVTEMDEAASSAEFVKARDAALELLLSWTMEST